jgi:pyruvoyl-dependent arginine decarboxylase (PvlArgDC)
MNLTPLPTIPYDTVITIIPAANYNLSNISSCIPAERVAAMLPDLALKTDAIKLGVLCFVVGMLVMAAFGYLEKRWKK